MIFTNPTLEHRLKEATQEAAATLINILNSTKATDSPVNGGDYVEEIP